MSKDIDSTVSPLAGFVPQVFFDLIARVTPGAFLILCSYFLVVTNPENFIAEMDKVIAWFKLKEGVQIIIFLGFMLASYITAVIMEGIYVLLKKIIPGSWMGFMDKQVENTKINALGYLKMNHSYISDENTFPDMYIMYDGIRMINPGAGARLVKLRAEFYMARGLFIGLFLLSIGNAFKLNNGTSPIVVEVCLIIFLVLFSAVYIRRRKTFLWGLHNHWALLREKEIVAMHQVINKNTPD